jgi:hypothetical protein
MGVFIFSRKPEKPPVQVQKVSKVPKAVKGRIAIVIDDLGYTSKNLSILEDIKYKMTFSVLPNLDYSEEVGSMLHKKGFEVMLHLPMEPEEKENLESNTVLTSMDESKIKTIISSALSSLPHVKGVSNHMGSKVTKDERTLKIILAEFKKRRLYFLDSFVTSKSLGQELAAVMKVEFAKRDIFLDNESDAQYIRGQIEQLKNKARQKGYAIGIGHDRKLTLEVLKEELPKIARDGYKLVFVSDLVK